MGAILLALAGCGKQRDNAAPPFDPQEALKTFQLPDGFHIELAASEPLLTDPVEAAFDENGLMYVAEMKDYPADAAPGGRIMLLEDKDNDGFYESGDVFADSLPYVNGVMPWRRGVLVTSAPDILYLEDTTGDRRADIRRVVLTGFALTNPQLRVSSLRYGLDNWIYGAYSRSGGQRGYPQFTNHGLPLTFPDAPLPDSVDIYPGTDFRMRPDSFWIEPSGGMSQFGMSFDADGNRFTVWNNIHLRHVVVDGRYPPRNPWLPIGTGMASVSDHGDAAPVFSKAEHRMDLHESEVGHFTSACGISIYTGGLFPEPYANAAFVCEPVSNLVHADILTKKGATFSGRRAEEGKEFLTSTDSWFRPVNTTVGPDGALYVVDFYRKLVEHPAWIARADEKGIYTYSGVLQDSDFVQGSDRGRIYRVVPDGFRRANAPPAKLGASDTKSLVQDLESPNMWWRLNAQRLLVDRQDKSAIPMLKTLFAETVSPHAKIHALRTLDGLRALDDAVIVKALEDANPAVRRQALLVSEPRLTHYPVLRQIRAMAADADDAVQFQVALTLSAMESYLSFQPVRAIALRHLDDTWFHTAALLNAAEHPFQWFQAFSDSSVTDSRRADFLQTIAALMAARENQWEVAQALTFLRADQDTALQRACLRGLADGLRRAGARMTLPPYGQNALLSLTASPAHSVRHAATGLAEMIALERSEALDHALRDALTIATDTHAPSAERAHATEVLGLNPGALPLNVFAPLLSPREPDEVREAAAEALARRDAPLAMALLVARWPSATPHMRVAIENAFTSEPKKISFLFHAIGRNQLNPSLLSRAARARLIAHADKDIQQRAEKLFAASLTDDRDKVVTSFYEATTMGGDAAKGKLVFRKTCSTCHLLEKEGHAFGPDLMSITNQTRINLLTMILDPNNNIAAGYDGYALETIDGRALTGIMAGETAAGVTLRTPEGLEQTVPRERIKTFRPLAQSLMPEGLETGLEKQDLADLLTY
jgi:putative membrane-bound dehydrogenase-like protein